ncbi:MAG: transposase [Thermoanaerobaculia bacterium]|nr:transposase [Thermoanaerobaculia bacterium]
MARSLRYIPPRSLVEVTTRTVQARFLLRPSRDLNEIVLGIVGRAAQRYDVKVCAFVFLSNHAHLLLQPADAEQLALFMGYVNGNLAKEAGRLHVWRERFWARRYQAIVVSHEEAAQVARLRYLLDNGCKESLVRRPADWPGAHCVEGLLSGRPLRGVWFDRSAEYEARRRGERVGKYTYSEEQELTLSPLPVWSRLERTEIRERVAEIVGEIEAATRRRIRKTGRNPLGIRRILRQHPHDKPERVNRSPAPRFHADRWAVRKGLELAYYAFRVAYRQAAEDLREGKLPVEFPAGCHLPRLPFARAAPAPAFASA